MYLATVLICPSFRGKEEQAWGTTDPASRVVNAPMTSSGTCRWRRLSATVSRRRAKDWGNEPFVAVNRTDTNDVAVSSVAFGTARNPDAAFFSTNGGTSWTLEFTVPSLSAGVAIPNDWTFAYDNAGTLHGAVLRGEPMPNVYQGMTTADRAALNLCRL